MGTGMAITDMMKAWLDLLYEHGTVEVVDVSTFDGPALLLVMPGHPLDNSTAFHLQAARTLHARGHVEIVAPERRVHGYLFSLTDKGVRFVEAGYKEAPPTASRSSHTTVNGPVGALATGPGATAINSGQVAHVINNFGPPRRVISPEGRARMLELLSPVEAGRIGLASIQGDLEAHEFKDQLITIFREAGWQTEDMHTFMFFGARKGIVVTISFSAPEDGQPQLVAQALALTGNPVMGNRGDMANTCGICVQVWHAP
jgi:hypothetical protein